MKCKQVKNLMGAYLYGDLTPDEMRKLRLHTRECEACREDLLTRGHVASLVDDKVPQLTDEEKQKIAWSVAGAVGKAERERKSAGFRLAPAFVLTAMLLVGVAVGGYVGVRLTKAHPPPRDAASAPGNVDTPIAVVKVRPAPHPQRKPGDDPKNNKDNSQDKTTKSNNSDGPYILINAAELFRAIATSGGIQPTTSRGGITPKHSDQVTPEQAKPTPRKSTQPPPATVSPDSGKAEREPQTPDASVDNGKEKLPPVSDSNDVQGR